MLGMLYDDMEVKAYEDEVRRERLLLGMTQREYAKYISIPYKTLLKLGYGIINM